MGIQLSGLVESKEIKFEELSNRKIAIDTFNWLYQFLSSIRQRDGQPLKDRKGNITSHLSGLFYRTINIIEAGIKPVYIFDGPSPHFKKEVKEARRNIRQEAMKEWEAALEKEDFEKARRYAQRAIELTNGMVEESKQLISAMGIPVIQAPNEGEAFCSIICRNDDVWAVATQDFDPLLFGAPRLIRNLNVTGKRKIRTGIIDVKPQIIVLKEVFEKLGINQDQLIMIGILVGTDYNPGGVHGYGPKKALDIIREKKTLEKAMESVEWNFEIRPEEIFDFFKNPSILEYDIKFGEPNEEKVKRLLCDEHDFSEERVSNGIKRIMGKNKDRGLGRWI